MHFLKDRSFLLPSAVVLVVLVFMLSRRQPLSAVAGATGEAVTTEDVCSGLRVRRQSTNSRERQLAVSMDNSLSSAVAPLQMNLWFRGTKVAESSSMTSAVFHLAHGSSFSRDEQLKLRDAISRYSTTKETLELYNTHFANGDSMSANEFRDMEQAALNGVLLCPSCDLVELGTFRGGSAFIASRAIQDVFRRRFTGKFITFDPFCDENAVRQRLDDGGVGRLVEIRRAWLEETSLENPVSFLFQDGGHNDQMNSLHFDYVVYASQLWFLWDRLITGAYVIVDDYGCPSHMWMKHYGDLAVRKQILEFMYYGERDAFGCYQLIARRPVPAGFSWSTDYMVEVRARDSSYLCPVLSSHA